MVRGYTTYQPLKVFLTASILCLTPALILFLRFLYYYFVLGQGGGRVQSLIIAVALTVTSAFLATIGILADMINTNRKLIEDILRRTWCAQG